MSQKPTRWVTLVLMFVLMLVSTFFGCKAEVYDDSHVWNPLPEPGEYASGGVQDFLLPFPSGDYYILTQGYGSNESGYTGSHRNYNFEYGDDTYALDFSQEGCAVYGDTVLPIMDGRVLRTATEGSTYDLGYGNNILIEHEDGFVSRYAHLSEIHVQEGNEVSIMDSIGAVGNSGNCSGTSCSSHPGAHLHLVLYQDGEGYPLLPLSGTDMSRYCWYNREGLESCNGYPGPYEPVDGYYDYDDDDGSLAIKLAYASPGYGTEDETEFVWLSVVESYDYPDVTLVINNPNDGVDYEFEMESLSDDSPYVFFYKKTLRDPIDYEFTIVADNDDEYDSMDGYQIEVDNDHGDVPEFIYSDVSPSDGEANDTEFEWEALVSCEEEPNVTLRILNPNDAYVYDFDMEVDYSDDDEWYATYEKTLRDPAIYVYFVEAVCDDLVNTSEVKTVETW